MWDINLQFCEIFFFHRIGLYNLQFQVYFSVFSEKKSELHEKVIIARHKLAIVRKMSEMQVYISILEKISQKCNKLAIAISQISLFSSKLEFITHNFKKVSEL